MAAKPSAQARRRPRRCTNRDNGDDEPDGVLYGVRIARGCGWVRRCLGNERGVGTERRREGLEAMARDWGARKSISTRTGVQLSPSATMAVVLGPFARSLLAHGYSLVSQTDRSAVFARRKANLKAGAGYAAWGAIRHGNGLLPTTPTSSCATRARRPPDDVDCSSVAPTAVEP